MQEEAAIRAEEDPSILDRINKAKENVLGQEEEDPVQAAKLKAELEAEAQKMSAQLEVWERGVASLIEKQYNLAIERLADLVSAEKWMDSPGASG